MFVGDINQEDFGSDISIFLSKKLSVVESVVVSEVDGETKATFAILYFSPPHTSKLQGDRVCTDICRTHSVITQLKLNCMIIDQEWHVQALTSAGTAQVTQCK